MTVISNDAGRVVHTDTGVEAAAVFGEDAVLTSFALKLGVPNEAAGFAVGYVVAAAQEALDEIAEGRAGQVGAIAASDPATLAAINALRGVLATVF
jgi:hypothetical protein